jgi:hypothetical protein
VTAKPLFSGEGEKIMSRLKVTGKIIFQQHYASDLTDAQILKLEMWLNNEIASQAFKEFGIGIRVHVTSEQELETSHRSFETVLKENYYRDRKGRFIPREK